MRRKAINKVGSEHLASSGEAGLKGPTALLEHAITHSPAIFYVVAQGGELPVTFVSPNVKEMTGLDPELFCRAPDYGRNCIHPDDRAGYLSVLEKVSQAGSSQLEYRLRDAGGRYLWVRDHMRSVADRSEGAAIVGCMVDVTAQKTAELSLHAVERLKTEMISAAASEQQAAAEEQRRLSALLRDAVEGIPNGLCIYDHNERLVLCNRAFAIFYGKPPAEMTGASATDIHRFAVSHMALIDGELVEDAEAWVVLLLERMRRGGGQPTEAKLRNGRWIQFNSYPTSDGGRIFVRRDVTAQKEAEISMREGEQLFRQMIESHPLPVWLIEADGGKIVYESPAAAALVGREWPSTEPHWVIDYYADPSARGPYLERLRQTGEVSDYEMEFKRVDGTRFWASATSRLLTYKGQELVLTANVDQTERRRREAELRAAHDAVRESEERFRGIAEAHPVPVIIIRKSDGVLLYASPATSRLWAKPQGEIIGSRIREYYADADERRRARDKFQQDGFLDNHEVRHRRADGKVIPVSLTSRAITYQGEDAVVCGIVDLTERKEAERRIAEQQDALHQSEKLNALGSLLAGVAHELNNPLLVVVGQALMLQETAKDPAIVSRAARIGAAADRCARIVKTFLQMARQQPPVREEVRLDEVVDSALDLTSYALRSTDIELIRNRGSDLPVVCADRDQLVQVLMNLIINAQQAMVETPGRRQLTITTRVKPAARAVQLVIEDTGPGIAPDVRSRIFEPFFTTKPEGAGTGIGLAVTRGIVQAHGGLISVQSEPGWGTAFILTFPAAPRESQAVEGAAKDQSEAAGQPCRVLVVDDESEILMTLDDILSADGHEVTTATSGEEALTLIGSTRFDAILTDVRMPGLDGPGLYSRLEAERPDLVQRLGFMTGDTLGPSARAFLKQAGRPCLEKPFTPYDARSLINRLTHDETAKLAPASQPT
jgi:PAS domain S-box-containing protein